MLISVFTPTHNVSRLDKAYASLREQAHGDWEWVIVPNHAAPAEQARVEEHARSYRDPRVVVRPYPPRNQLTHMDDGPLIGALKRFACEACTGELLVELDHDDWLLPHALARLAREHEARGAGFYYSDAIIANEGGASTMFDTDCGWSYYPYKYEGTDYLVAHSFAVSPRSLAEIFFAPNHVRCWQREAYWLAGGHSGKLGVADDHELLCRTYLSGCEMALIPEPLYYYLQHDANSFVRHNEQVQATQQRVMNSYLHALVREWCRRNSLLMIDLGGAHNCPRELGFKALDRHGDVDYRCDIFHMPFTHGEVGCFRAVDFLEHFPPGDGSGPDVTRLMNLLYYMLADRGWLLAESPSVVAPDGTVGAGAFQDPTHKSYWCENSFWYFTDKDFARFVPNIACRFQAARLWTDHPSEWHQAHRVPYVCCDLMAVKDTATPVPGGMRI
jgi:glycosyltransferase involved in cell wall biosynthesis